MESQGYNITKKTLYQDNKSAIILEKNRKISSSKRTKHLMVWYFLKDKVDQGEVSIKYCPTEQMWSDILTKPLQRQQFRLMRAIIMNCQVNCEEESYQDIIKNKKSNDDTKEQIYDIITGVCWE